MGFAEEFQRSIKELRSWVGGYSEELKAGATDLVNVTISDAMKLQTRILLDAHTDTGRAREEAGLGVPGRMESGDMIYDISGLVAPTPSGVRGEWGWEHPQFYYAIQDAFDPEGIIEPAESMLGSYLQISIKFRERVFALAAGKDYQ